MPVPESMAPSFQLLTIVVTLGLLKLAVIGLTSFVGRMVTKPVGVGIRSLDEITRSLAQMIGRVQERNGELSRTGSALQGAMDNTSAIASRLQNHFERVRTSIDQHQASCTQVEASSDWVFSVLETLQRVLVEHGATVNKASASIE